jgi:hypothetical protein
LEKAETKMMMKKMIRGLVALGFGCLLFGADNAFVGTWKMNMAKSSAMQFSPEGKLINKSEIKDDIATVAVEGDTLTVRSRSTISGKPVSSVFTVPTAGGPLNYTEGPPPPGITDTLKVVDDRTYDFISTENGKVVLTTRCQVSANHKRMTITSSGVDANGKAFKTVVVDDRQ